MGRGLERPDPSGRQSRGGDSVDFPQSTGKLLRALPIAGLMAGASALLLLVGLRGAGLLAVLAGVLAFAFFGPALLILLWTVVRPNYLRVEAGRLRFRLYGVEASIPWGEIHAITGGVGWPSLTFRDPERVVRSIRFRGIPLLGWILEIPTRIVSFLIRRPLANMYPTTRRQLVSGFRANERMFGFHYGLPTSLLEGSTASIVEVMRRAAARAPQPPLGVESEAEEP